MHFVGDVRHVVVVLSRDGLRAIAQQLFLALARIGEPAVRRDAVQPCREFRFLSKRL
jgi:hypothetical protein